MSRGNPTTGCFRINFTSFFFFKGIINSYNRGSLTTEWCQLQLSKTLSHTQYAGLSASDVFFSKSSPVWEHRWEWRDCFPQQGLMMPDGLFSCPVPMLKADHYRALCAFMPPKMSCHQHEEQDAARPFSIVTLFILDATTLGGWAGLWFGRKTRCFQNVVNNDL